MIASQPIPKFAGGGSFVVPPGYPNDSYMAVFENGERVTVEKAADVAGGSDNIPVHVTINLNEDTLYKAIARGTRNRRLLIDLGAVV